MGDQALSEQVNKSGMGSCMYCVGQLMLPNSIQHSCVVRILDQPAVLARRHADFVEGIILLHRPLLVIYIQSIVRCHGVQQIHLQQSTADSVALLNTPAEWCCIVLKRSHNLHPSAAINVVGSLESPATAAATSASAPESPSQQDAGPLTEEEQQQQQNLKGIEDRLSFLEMELLKQSISVDAISSLACAAEPSNSSSSMHQHRHLAPSAAATAEAEPGSMQLDPEVLAIAESLLVRQGRVIPVSGSSNLGTADSTLHRQQQWQQQQMGGASTSSIWGRHYAFRQQIKAKPGRYTEQCLDPYGNPKKQPGRGKMLPNGHLPDADMVNSYDLELTRADDLVPYEPDGWSVAGTILLVYAGVLLTFFAVIAGTAEGSNVVDPDMLMMFW